MSSATAAFSGTYRPRPSESTTVRGPGSRGRRGAALPGLSRAVAALELRGVAKMPSPALPLHARLTEGSSRQAGSAWPSPELPRRVAGGTPGSPPASVQGTAGLAAGWVGDSRWADLRGSVESWVVLLGSKKVCVLGYKLRWCSCGNHSWRRQG